MKTHCATQDAFVVVLTVLALLIFNRIFEKV